ncbi:hypothetical protein PR202_ga18852 [Eleusine coracana subsp. coracana]|uniref:DNA-directed RNA polymerase n=1 Tax=Eleusine coracana subsp. coracana TaxID=191504 RepID=A0AAV5CU85_ELECO|nr:hypothetical protein PR202_ga18852 [Eleusine coracana subsp. coracana]
MESDPTDLGLHIPTDATARTKPSLSPPLSRGAFPADASLRVAEHPSRPTPLSHGGGVFVPASYGSPLGRHLRRGPSVPRWVQFRVPPSAFLLPTAGFSAAVPQSTASPAGLVVCKSIQTDVDRLHLLLASTRCRVAACMQELTLLATSACAMEEPPKDNVQSLSGSDSELEPMTVDNNGAETSHYMDGANCESPIDVDEGQSPIDVDEGQSSVDVDMKGKSVLDDDTKGRSSLESRTQVPVELSVKSLEKFCREASRSFFDEIGLISHQINSYNEFISHGLQELFDSLGEVIVEPGYDPSKKGSGGWKHAIIKFGRVKLEKPVFWSGKDEADISFKPRHARLQNMTYASRMKAEVTIQVLNNFFVLASSTNYIYHDLLENKEAFDVLDLQDCDASVINTITMTIKESDEVCEGFRKSNKARQYVDELIKSSRFPPAESFDDYVARYLFPGISGNRNKALFLGYMVKCLLMAFIGKRKCDNKDDFRNKRLELAGELLGRELRAHIRHAERRMVKAIQRDLNGDRDLQELERYVDASIITNGLNRAFSTGSWCHPYKKNERCSGIVATLRRTNPLQMMSDLRKTRQRVAYAGKAGDARYPRVLYQSEKHSQQAIGYSTTNPLIRVDTLSHQLYYPQKPLFKTVVADCIGRSDYASGRNDDDFARPEYFNGQNAIVAVNVHQGFNQEDSLVMNKASLERGMFRTEHLRSYKAEVENKDGVKRLRLKEKIDFGKMESKRGRVDNLDDDGLPYIGASLQTNDIVIGKVSETGEDHSIKLKHTEKGMVQKVLLSANDEGKNFAVVTLRQVRSPCLGDKFSSMHGQKGVVGFLESQENFPFTHQGIVPDIVINPHAFPTRQTPGQLLEAALGKGIALGGRMRYATPFTAASVDVIAKQLHKAGFSRWGAESVLNGRTGERMQSLVFMGPTFYQRLIHMSEDKVKFRNTGPVHPLTRQPVADRKRFGGVKFGEMERDCLLAHGAAANLHERLFMLSDFSQMHVCQTCERVANVIMRSVPGGKKIRGPYCGFCKSSENIVRINVPYGAKLLYQELFSMGICLKFETEVC